MFLQESYPKAILHVDGDAFFASCEMAKNPALKGKPIVVGQERGIATAVSYEAKALGVVRGMTMWHIRDHFPKVIIVSSDYESYALFSRKMYTIVRRFTPIVEEYSIDECFADLTSVVEHIENEQDRTNKIIEIGKSIKHALETELDLSFSVGIGPTKVLSKVASKWNKPSGFTAISGRDIEIYLEKLAVKKIWGIGSSSAHYLKKLGVESALQFASQTEQWVQHYVPKPIHEIWYELKGTSLYDVNLNPDHQYKSVSKTGSFKPTFDKNLLFSQLSKNVERMCAKLRRHKLRTRRISFFIKTQEFSYHGGEVILPNALAIPTEIIKILKKPFEKVYKPRTLYRATGVTAYSIVDEDHFMNDLFGYSQKTNSIDELFQVSDKISEKLGKGSVFLASSLQSIKENQTLNKKPAKNTLPRFIIPFLGEAT
jgi:DNA polymerase-4/DNA polymerase V